MPAERKSAELHALHGSKPHDRASDLSHVPSGRPRFPRDLDASLKPTFKRLCGLLAERRTLTAGDAELIRLFCFIFDRHTRNVALLRTEGEICSYTRLDNNGRAHEMVKPNYRLKVVENAERQMAAILNQLGLTPTAKDRAKPTAAGPNAMKVVPGSIADIAPHLVGLAPKPLEPMSFLTPELQAQLATMSFEDDPEPVEHAEEEKMSSDHVQEMIALCTKIGFDAARMSPDALADVYFVGVHDSVDKLDSMTLQERLEFRELVRARVTHGPIKFLPDVDLSQH